MVATDLYNQFQEVCNKLGLSNTVTETAWQNFETTKETITLEGDLLHWGACAIFTTNWNSVPPNASQATANNPQNTYINFTALLKYCNLSLAQFFQNVRRWCEMTHLSADFKRRIDYLERAFCVSCNVFKEYKQLFPKIFKQPELGELEQGKQRNRKQKSLPCTPAKVFEFCWNVFVTIKGECPSYTKELVDSCNLLIAVCDWAFKNAFLAERRDLLNPDFPGLPENWSRPNYVTPEEAPCIVALLCPTSNVTDVKYIKEYCVKKAVDKLFDAGILTGKDNDYYNYIFDPAIFERNFKNVTSRYEVELLKKGTFDERIFLAEHRRKWLEQQQKQAGAQTPQQLTASGEKLLDTPRDMGILPECLTPLTARQYLGPRESGDPNGHPSPMANISKLNGLLVGRKSEPSDALAQVFRACSRNPAERIRDVLARLSGRFSESYEPTEQANKRLQLATVLFYKVVENILQNERVIHADVSAIVEKDVFYECVFACCLEIVIYSYGSRYKFPWIVQTLQIQPYNFVKVIELIIRSKDNFSRDVIKHLNMIEEKIFSSMIWESNSIIWKEIALSSQEVPKFEEIALPGQLHNEQGLDKSTLRSILTNDKHTPGPSVMDRFQSPITHGNSATSRQLFSTGQATQFVLKDSSGTIQLVELPRPVPTKLPESPPRPRRTGGLSIVFRKFYNLAGERMEHLCTNLRIVDLEMKRKIWTVFEELVRKNNCEFIKDRDLDQLLMCSVYMIFKLSNSMDNGKKFAEIMRAYRKQPQAHSDIYRNVLIRTSKTVDDKEIVVEKRGDLIAFYNQEVIQALSSLAQKFKEKRDVSDNSDLLLSPLPRRPFMSPGVQVSDNIYVKLLESPGQGVENAKSLNYFFMRSPQKDLENINNAIRGNGVTGKRLYVDGTLDLPPAKRSANKKVQSLIEDRRNQNTE